MKSDLKEVFNIAGLQDELDKLPPVEYAPPEQNEGTELSRLSIFIRNSDKQSLFTFIELEGYPILRITLDGQSHDLILNNDQVKLLLRQMTLWLTR